MKQIPNKQTNIKNTDDTLCRYSDLIELVRKQPKQGGYDYTDIETRLAISKAITNNPDTIELEDAPFNYLKKLVEAMRWNVIDEDLLNFKNDIMAIK